MLQQFDHPASWLGTELQADLVVCATGYASMNSWAARLIDQQTADKVGKCKRPGKFQNMPILRLDIVDFDH